MSRDSSRNPPIRLGDYFFIAFLSGTAASIFLMGAFFWTKARFHFSDTENLLLNATQGISVLTCYYGGRFSDRIGYNRILKFSLLGMALTLGLGWIPQSRLIPYVLFALMMLLMGPTWPTLEASIYHSQSDLSLITRTGIYNILWSGGFFCGFFISGFLVSWKIDSVVWIAGAVYLMAWAWLFLKTGKSQSRCVHELKAQEVESLLDSNMGKPNAKKFMHYGWLGNCCNFILLAGFSALAPAVVDQVRLEPSFGIWLSCTFLLARSVSFLILWKWQGWKYRMRFAQAGLWLAPLALCLVFFTYRIDMVFIGLTLFGFTAALSYSGSLFYSLDYGKNKGQHGGLHESIIGGGFFFGSLVGAIGSYLTGSTKGAEMTLVLFSVVVIAVGCISIHKINSVRPR